MNKFKKLMCLFLSVLMILSMGIPAFAIDRTTNNSTSTNETQKTATTTEKNPLTIEISTNKADYKVTNVAEITATVTNTGKEDIKNVSAEAVFNDLAPVGKKTSETKKEVETLKAGESISFTYKATLNASEHKLNLFQKIFLWFVRLFNGGYTPSDNGFDNGRDCTEQTYNLIFGKFATENVIKVWYGENGSISDNEDTVTRGEWILKLADTLDWSEQIKMMNNTNCEFDDIEGHKCEKAVQYASIMNVFDETAGSFYPDEPATREFAAVTAVRAMGFLNTETIECADKNSIKHPYEVHSAVTIGIFELSNNKFYADKEFTVKESEKAIAKISEIEGTRQNTPEHSEIVYNDNFVELSNNVKYTQINDEKFSVEKSEETKNLQIGQIVFLNDEYYKIANISEENGQYIVDMEYPEIWEIFDSMDIGGSTSLSMDDFILADGVQLVEDENEETETFSRAKRSSGGTVDIGKKSFQVSVEIQENVEISGKIKLKNIIVDYKSDIDWKHFNVKDVHFVLGYEAETSVELKDSRKDKSKPIKDGSITLGTVPVLGVAGIGIYIEVSIAYSIDGIFEIKFNTNGNDGFQICNNKPILIHSFSADFDCAAMEATAKVGPKISGLMEVTKKLKLIDFSLFAGAAAKGTVKIRDTGLTCLNASLYAFAKFEAMQESAIGKWLDIKWSSDIWDENSSPLKCSWHFENMVRVPECTYTDKEITASGTCGDNLTWLLREDGELFIIGIGAMTNYSSGKAPWYSYRDNIKIVTIRDGVTSIGDYAFHNCTNLVDVKMSSNITTIGKSAFSNCTGITEIQIPNSVTTIYHNAFNGCVEITDITLPQSIKSIYGSAFANTSITEILVPKSISTMATSGNSMFETNRTSAFYGASKLKKVIFESGTETIPYRALRECSQITEVVIPNTVTKIGEGAFENCTGLTGIELPNSIAKIEDNAFKGCSELRSITINNPNCTIYDSENTISGTATIYGYSGSTAEAYAKKYNREFVTIVAVN